MAIARSRAAPGAQTDSGLPLNVLIIPGLLYPWWHLLAPRSATDPWLAWWLIGGAFLLVALLTRWSAFVKRHRSDLLMLCGWLVTLQLYLLAFVNAMHPFYAVGSTMAVLTIALIHRNKLALCAYVGFVLLLSGTLFALEPEAIKAAYWSGMLPVLAFAYHRLAVQTSTAELLREHQEQLEANVEQRTRELSETNARLLREMEEKASL